MIATYRLQLHAGFSFADAEAVVPYLRDLGVTHLYLSPILTAVTGSLHGYDVLDHTRVSEALGGRSGFGSLADTARSNGLGIVVDVVPNHMAMVPPEHANAPVWELLRNGPEAATASWFDVDWAALENRIGLPVLGEDLDEAVSSGALRLDEHAGAGVLRYHDHVFPLAPGSAEHDVGGVLDVLSRQHYLLACWRERDQVLNYRRFFDVDTLIAVRVEAAEVFEATHELLLDLNHEGLVEGFRIDHVDGLADPAGYLTRLRERVRPGTAIWVEKILEPGERLPASWPVEGGTGYDAARAVTAALLDPASGQALTGVWESTGESDFATTVGACKTQVYAGMLAPERRRLERVAVRALPDADPGRVAEALSALVLALGVYRTYVRPGTPAASETRTVLAAAGESAAVERPELKDELGRLVELAGAERPGSEAALEFAVRFGQTCDPVMAKGVEDTAYYRWHRMDALNEVGGDPLLLDHAAPEMLHEWAAEQQRSRPLSMTGLSTHDSKRSEDVRARLIALAGDAESWVRCAEAFTAAAAGHDVHPADAQLVWQTLAGAGDIGEERLTGYLLKALREAKERTAHVDGDPGYETRVLALAAEASAPGRLKALVDTALEHNAEAIRASVLGQKLLALTLPGVADSYQGTEVVNLRLVDPDNRWTANFATMRNRLEGLAVRGPRDLDDEKLLLTSRTLALRRELGDSFGEHSDYLPVVADTRHVVGFVRGEVAVLVTRALQRLQAAGGWGDLGLELPEGLWRDELTEHLHGGGENRCVDVFEDYPVALLRRVHRS